MRSSGAHYSLPRADCRAWSGRIRPFHAQDHLKLSVVIPIYNEAATAATLLQRVRTAPLPTGVAREMVIVESASTDGSHEIVQAFAEAHRSAEVRVVLQERPRGKGHAVREGLALATGDIVLIQDGDLEYDVADYPALLAPILAGRATFVLGSRHLGGESWVIRRFEKGSLRAPLMNVGGVLFHAFFNAVYGTRLTDPTTMYKVFRRSAVDGLTFVSDRFDFDFELVAKLIRSGHVPVEVPISYNSRSFEEGKKIRMIRDPLTWVWAILRFRFAKL